MDSVDRAVEKRLHISSDKEINKQTWEQFEANACDKKLFIYGAGAITRMFWKRYQYKMHIEGIVDGDEKKCGRLIDDILPDVFEPDLPPLYVCKPIVLTEYNPEEIVVLVASVNYYEEIIDELNKRNIYNCYSILIMEANRRLNSGIVGDEYQIDFDKYALECCNFQINSKKIILSSFYRNYSDHEKYIAEQLLKLRCDLDIVLIVDDLDEPVPNGIRKIFKGSWKKFIYEMETAHIWILNTIIPGYIKKRQGQIYIQTKHWASVTLKKFYLGASTITDVDDDVRLWRYNSECMDYIITGSDFDMESCRQGFEFDKDFIQAGSPRSDAMFKGDENKRKICSIYGLDINRRILLYAPTYRYQKNVANHVCEIREVDLDYEGVKHILEERFGGEWCIMLRLHPGHEKEIEKLKLPGYVIDASTYSDGQELASACDVMISDYSSIMFEPAFVKKPVFLFATDRKDYIDKEYDLLIDYDTLPFPIAESNEKLVHNIENFDQVEYEKKLDAFMEKYGVHEDGHASERAAEFISGLIDGQ